MEVVFSSLMEDGLSPVMMALQGKKSFTGIEFKVGFVK